MRAEFLAAAQKLSIDIAFQRESIFRRNRRSSPSTWIPR